MAEKQAEVDDARRTLEQKLAELRAVRADAAVQATKLGSAVDDRLEGAINDARVDVPVDAATLDTRSSDDGPREYYIRDRDGRFIRVARP